MGEDETQFWREHFRAAGKQVMLLSPRQIWIPEAGVIVGMGALILGMLPALEASATAMQQCEHPRDWDVAVRIPVVKQSL